MRCEPVIYQAVSRAVPHVRAVRLTEGGCSWLRSVVSIRKQHAGDAKNAIMAAFGAHTSMKHVVVDDDIDVFDDHEVEWAIATRFQADRGFVVLHGVRSSSIDPSATDGFAAKVGIDATRPWGRHRGPSTGQRCEGTYYIGQLHARTCRFKMASHASVMRARRVTQTEVNCLKERKAGVWDSSPMVLSEVARCGCGTEVHHRPRANIGFETFSYKVK